MVSAEKAQGCRGSRTFTQQAMDRRKACSAGEGDSQLGQGQGDLPSAGPACPHCTRTCSLEVGGASQVVPAQNTRTEK